MPIFTIHFNLVHSNIFLANSFLYRYITITLTGFNINNIYTLILFILDLLLLIHNYILSIQCAMFSSIIIICTIHHYFVIRFVNGTLKNLSQLFNFLNEKYLNQINLNQIYFYKNRSKFDLILEQVLTQHFNLCHYYLYTYTELWNYAMFAFIFCSLPFNVICVSALTENHFMIDKLILIVFILIVHSVIIVLLLLLMAWQTETLYRSMKFLPPIIQWIDLQYNWRLKIQYFEWFNLLASRTKFGPFIALIGNVNYHTVFNVGD